MTAPLLARAGVAAGIVAAAAGLAGCAPDAPPPMPPLQIAVTTPQPRDIPIQMEAVGETLGSVDIPIRARVDGVLEEMHFREGRPVERGQLLYVIDARPYQAQVVEAEGRLAEARTRLAKAESDLARIRPLAEIDAVSRQDLDSAVAQYEAAVGALQAARAQVEQTEIQLGYTRIRAPVDGLIGISQAKVGEYVGRAPNPVVLNVVSEIDPIRVRFSISEVQYLRARRAAILAVDGDQPSRQAPLELILADGSVHDYRGSVVSFDANVDPTTGTLTVEADFPNPDRLILPGQFARIRAEVEVRRDALAVPQRAVIDTQGVYQLAVVNDDDTVELRRVEMGPRVGTEWIVNSGLAPGERIALEGLQRLRSGMKVTPKPAEAAGSGT
ncbi:MAG: efflux RND transporter periplasmic adaptor subunit [Gammaproteobacteria bacterium]